jgi:DNA-binding transcriptional ArsR family regulator
MKTKAKWLGSSDMRELTEMFKAMSHPSRMAIIYLLCTSDEKRMTVQCFYTELDMAQPVISRHLGILKNSGLLIRKVEGSKTFYELRIANKNVAKLKKCFLTFDKL